MPAAMALGALSMGTSWALTRWARRFLAEGGVVDVPNHRSSHDRIVPRGAGVVLAPLTVLLTVIGGAVWSTTSAPLFASLIGGLALSAVGSWDDRRDLPVRARLYLQGAVSFSTCSYVVYGLDIDEKTLGLFAAFVACVAIVGTTNVFNFMDGIDGIAGATSIAVGTGLVLHGTLFSHGLSVVTGTVLVGVAAGFLLHNWPPATVFLGDSGSLFFGFVGTTAPLAIAFDDPHVLFVLGALVPFLVDGLATLGQRLLQGAPVTEAHRGHLYQQLARRFGHAPVSLSYGCAAAACGLIPVWVSRSSPLHAGALTFTSAAIAFASWNVARRRMLGQ